MPAIDLLDEKVVRLYQGRYDHIFNYPLSPIEIAQGYQKQGLNFLHVIDLDGAKEGQPKHLHLIDQLLQMKLSLQVGGGIRTLEMARHYLQMGVERIILSTMAIQQEGFWQTLVDEFSKERLALSLDVKNDIVLTDGWYGLTAKSIAEIVEKIGQENILHLIVTDVLRDGTKEGPNLFLYQELKQKYPSFNLIAAGGITTISDLTALEKIGLQEAIVGRALYENQELRHYLFCQQIDWKKQNGLVPAIVQSADDGVVLMLGYMTEEALKITLETKAVTFFSRSRQELWTKGTTSGNTLTLVDIALDCDRDTLLLTVKSHGPTCHVGTKSCFKTKQGHLCFLSQLEEIIDKRMKSNDPESYVFRLTQKGAARVAQKVGEEAVETALASLMPTKESLKDESADLLFHLLVNLRFHNIDLEEIVTILEKRHGKTHSK